MSPWLQDERRTEERLGWMRKISAAFIWSGNQGEADEKKWLCLWFEHKPGRDREAWFVKGKERATKGDFPPSRGSGGELIVFLPGDKPAVGVHGATRQSNLRAAASEQVSVIRESTLKPPPSFWSPLHIWKPSSHLASEVFCPSLSSFWGFHPPRDTQWSPPPLRSATMFCCLTVSAHGLVFLPNMAVCAR